MNNTTKKYNGQQRTINELGGKDEKAGGYT